MVRLMRRCSFHIASAVSLLLLVAVVVVWVRSYWVRDIVSFVDRRNCNHTIQSLLGRVHIISNLDRVSSGGFTHRQYRLAPDAIWNGAMSGYPLKVEWRL